MFSKEVCFVVFVIFYITTASNAMTDEQKAKIHEHFEQMGMECIKDNPISEDDIMALKDKKHPSGENVPCFLSCMFMKIGVMDVQGMMNKENSLELAKKVFEDAEELKNIADFIHSCSGVNTEAVSDGTKGCERATKAYKCMLMNAAKFGLEI